MPNREFDIKLRPTEVADLEHLFRFQLDEEAGYLAAFMPKDPADQTAYLAKFTGLLSDPSVNNQTILVDKVIAGSVAKFEMQGEAEITYWIDKIYWRKGIATEALKSF